MDILKCEYLLLLFCFTVCLSPNLSAQNDVETTVKLENTDPFHRELLTYDHFNRLSHEKSELELKHIAKFQAEKINSDASQSETYPLIAVFVDEPLYSSLQSAIDTYVSDLTAEGYDIELILINGGSAPELKTELQSLETEGLVGSVIIGRAPIAWYELDDEEFPIDLYFMDLDGIWIDADGDNLYDNHTGDVEPEIWIGRINAGSFSLGNEIPLTQMYFVKNHAYRDGSLTLPKRGLAFVDDDWSYFGSSDLDQVYNDITVINGYNQTTAANYQTQLLNGYEFIHLMAHSCPWAHTFRTTSGYGGCFFNFDLDMIEPEAFFYNLFACSNTRFVELDNIGNYYIFKDQYGLLVVGSAKTGSMLEFQDFYAPLGNNNTFGDSFLQWFQAQAAGGFSHYEKSWFYGMSLLGDPTLKANQSKSTKTHNQIDCSAYRLDKSIGEKISSSTYSDGHQVIESVENENLMCAWMSGINGRSSICTNYFNGSTWTGQTQVHSYEYWEINPEIIGRANGDIDLFFARFTYSTYNYDIYRSQWSGSSWSTPQTVNPSIGYDIQPSVAERNGDLHLVWQNWRDLNANIYWSFESESDWSTPQCITPSEEDDIDPVLITDSQDKLSLFYSSRDHGKWDIVFRQFDGIWSTEQYVSDHTTNDICPDAVAGDSGDIWVVYISDINNNSDLVARYFDGSNWDDPEIITSTGILESCPKITLLNGNPVVIYHTKGEDQVLKIANRNGSSWTIDVFENSSGKDQQPDIARISTGENYVAWCSNKEGDSNVYVSEVSIPFTTPTPTPPFNPTSTPPPHSSPTITPTASTPTHTPTASPQCITIEITTNSQFYESGDRFLLECSINNSSKMIVLDEYIVLDVYGNYWYWPTWTATVDFVKTTIPEDSQLTETIFDFIWPENAGHADGIKFWAALLKPGSHELFCDFSYCTFSY